MLEPFFGLHQAIIRSGFWAKMKPGEKDLYTCLAHRSERNSSREVTMTDESVRKDVGTAPRTLCNARKKLQERGLIQCRKIAGNKYLYIICDPDTGKPYPGSPKQRVRYEKQSKQKPENSFKVSSLAETRTSLVPQNRSQRKMSDDSNMTEDGLAHVFEEKETPRF